MNEIEVIYNKQKNNLHIKSFELHRNLNQSEDNMFDLRIVMSTIQDDINDELVVVFKKISNLKIGNIENLLTVFININDVSHYQNENVKYEVYEYENNLFSFFCNEVIIM